jgi:CheY-like chemotaxis protein
MQVERPGPEGEGEEETEPPSRDRLTLVGVHVLVVDDDESLAELFVRALLAAGAVVRSTPNGREALEALRDARFDVLVSDLDMPHLDGLGLVSQVRASERHRALPALALTGSTTPDIRRRALEAGFDEFATKPVLAADLVAAVKRLLGAKAARALERPVE